MSAVARFLKTQVINCSSFFVVGALFTGGYALQQKAHAATTEVNGPKVTWSVSLHGNRRGQTEGLEKLKAILEKKTSGNFQLQLHYGEALSSVRDVLQNIRIGAFEMGLFCAAYDPSKVPALSGLELPFIPANQNEFLDRVALEEAYIDHPAVLGELRDRWNAQPIIMGTLPGWGIMGVGEAPESLEDLDGLRMYAAPMEGMLYQEFGAVITTVTAPELFQAMEKGIVEAASWPWTYAFFSYGINELADWYSTDFGGVIGRSPCPIVANKRAFDSLPPQYKKLIEDSKGEAYRWQAEQYEQADKANLQVLDSQGMVEVSFDKERLDSATETLKQKIWGTWIKERDEQGLPGNELATLLEKESF